MADLHQPPAVPPFLAAGGEMAERILHFDWSATPLGPITGWPSTLCSTVAMVLRSPVPIVTLWGRAGIMLYNDSYAIFGGNRHPQLLGLPVLEAWPEVADFNAHVVEVVLAGGTLAFRDQQLTLNRTGTPEPAWLDLDYSPIIDESGTPIGVIAIVLETTAKVRAEQRLSGERERLQRMFELSPGFMATLTGPDHVFESANPAYLQLVGHREILGKPMREALPELADQGFYKLLDRVRASATPFIGRAVPIQLQPRPGAAPRPAFLDFAYQPIIDEGGAVSGIFVTGYEVTELRETQDRLRMAQRAGHVGSFELYPSARTLVVSDEFCRLWGLPEAATLPVHEVAALLHPEDRKRVRTTRETVEPDALGYMEYRIRRADTGEERWLARRGEAFPGEAGGPMRFAGVVYDITDRKRVEEQLRLLNDTLEQRVAERTAERDRIWRLSTDIMLVADLDGRILSANPAWTGLLGWTQEELVGRTLLEFIHPDDAHASAAEIERLRRGEHAPRFENRYRHKDGSHRWISWAAVPGAQCLHGVGRDIQAEKEAQFALEAAQEALRQSHKMEAVGQLTGGIAHDFNNLLTVVSGNIDMARCALDIEGANGARISRALDNAAKGAARAAALTQRLLAFSRRQPLAPRGVRIDRLVEDLSDMLARSLGETIRLEIASTPTLWPVEADPNQLESALLNLAVNARDAMPVGGRLAIRSGNRTLPSSEASAAGVPAGDYVEIAVADTGTGMPPEMRARAFEPFFTTKEVGKGTGLGLSMVYGFVRQSGGTVSIHSTEGLGTTVRILLPRMAGELPLEPADSPPGDLPTAHGQRGTILAVEDDADVRAYTVETLRDLGHEVLEARDGASALELLTTRGTPIDLLFTDVVMPGMSGRDLAEAALAARPALKVLYTSGYTRQTIDRAGRLDVGVEMLAKPFTRQQLAQKIGEMLNGG